MLGRASATSWGLFGIRILSQLMPFASEVGDLNYMIAKVGQTRGPSCPTGMRPDRKAKCAPETHTSGSFDQESHGCTGGVWHRSLPKCETLGTWWKSKK